MPALHEMDPRVSFVQQMSDATEGPVVLINTFVIGAEDCDRFLDAWSADAAVMKRQPGFISTQLHRGIGGSGVFINCAVWESIDAFKRAFFNRCAGARRILSQYLRSVCSQHRECSVMGHCHKGARSFVYVTE